MSRSRQIALRILRNRDLRRLFVAFLVFNAVEYGTWIALLVYAYQTTGPASVGVVAVVMLVPDALIAPAAAALGDRFPRRHVLAGGHLGYGIGLAVTAAAMVGGAPAPLVYAVATIGSAPFVLVRPNQSALLPSLCQTPDELTAANGAAGIVEGVGVLVGPTIAALALSGGGPPVVVALGAAAVFTGGLLVTRLRAPSAGIPSEPEPMAIAPLPADPSAAFGAASGLRVVVADREARLVVGLMSARMLMVGAADVLFVLMAIDLLGMGEPGAGVLNAALGVGTIVGGATSFVLVGRTRLASVAAVGACLWGLALGLSGWLASAPVATVLIVAGGAGLAVVDVAGRTILQRSIRDEVLARVFGIQEALAIGALAAGSILVSGLMAVFGLTGAILVLAVLLPLIVALVWTQLVALDARSPVPTRAIALLRRVAVFVPLPAPELEAIARRAEWQSVEAGKVVIREGDIGDRYYVLASGTVLVEREGRRLRELSLPGDGFGEIALLRDVPRTATVTTTGESVFLTVDRGTFLAAVTGNRGVRARADQAVAAAAM